MNKFSLCFVLFGTAVVLGLSNASEFSCVPGQTYKEDCNTCVCSDNGKSALCTQVACLSEPVLTTEDNLDPTETTEGSLEHVVTNNNHVCTPNDIKIEDCNRCRCAANGIGWFCTRRACASKKRATQSPFSSCTPGQRWSEKCNNCFCTDSGFPVCTMMFCLDEKENLLRQKRSPQSPEKCTPGTTWKNDCNTCFCTETGIPACTLKGCLRGNAHHMTTVIMRTVSQEEFSNSNFTCQPSESFKLVCNICKCGTDGKSTAWCTKKRCIPGE